MKIEKIAPEEPHNLTLSTDEIHIWVASLIQPENFIQKLTSTLSKDELVRASRFHFQHHTKHFMVARGILRKILSLYLKIHPSQVQFNYNSKGKPSLKSSLNSQSLEFNLSHSGELALYALTRDRALGIDIEFLRPLAEVEQIAKNFFSAAEYAWIQGLPNAEKQSAFLRYWTGKEAYLKAIGEGLSHPLEEVEMTLNQGVLQLNAIAGSTEAAQRWCLTELQLDSDYRATLAVEKKDVVPSFKIWQWQDKEEQT